jgi:Flp pilus assembly protein TadG
MIRRIAHIRSADEGATAVELVVVMTAALFLIFGMIEFAIAYWTMHMLQFATQEGGRYAMVMVHNGDSNPTTGAETVMQGNIWGPSSVCTSPTAGQYCVKATLGANNKTLTLTAYYGFDIIGFTGKFALTGQTTVPLD